MNGLRWGKFVWNDWQSDPALRGCGFAARGLWMDMLCIAAVAEPVGYLKIAGETVDADRLARITQHPVDEIEPLLAELRDNGVFSVNRQGAIFSRRMVRDARTTQRNTANGKKGGNPLLRKHEAPQEDNASGLRQNQNQSQSQKKTPPKPPQGHDRFPEFWAACPKRVGKGQAARAWSVAIKKADAGTIIAAIKRFAVRQRGEDPKYICHPATWLNGERWLDEPVEPPVPLFRHS